MKKMTNISAGLALAMASSSFGAVILNEDFDGLTADPMVDYGVNADVGNIANRNGNMSSTVILASDVPAFTTASGNILCINNENPGGTTGFAITTAGNNAFDLTTLAGLDGNATVTFSLDYYIPATLDTAVGLVNLRFKDGTNTGNNNSNLGANNVTAAGVGSVTFSGIVSDLVSFTPDTTQFFMSLDQDNSALTDGFIYIDNINFEITPVAVPEPSSLVLLGFGMFGFAVRRRR